MPPPHPELLPLFSLKKSVQRLASVRDGARESMECKPKIITNKKHFGCWNQLTSVFLDKNETNFFDVF